MILPAILEKDFPAIQYKLDLLDGIADKIQLDVSDGVLVEGETFLDISRFAEIKCQSKIELHLMVVNPLPYLTTKIANVASICTQLEGEFSIQAFIDRCRELRYQVGLSMSPETDVTKVLPFLDQLDFVQFMTVHPGKQGNDFIPEVLDTITNFRKSHHDVTIQADGGVSDLNIKPLLRAGVNNVVIGSAIFGTKDPKLSYKVFERTELETLKEILPMDTQLASLSSVKRKINKIAFLGGAAWKSSDKAYTDAFETARLLAHEGFEIVNGGGPGVMKASTKGAHAGNGRALAITYHPNKPKRHYEGVDITNDFDEEIITLDYFDRTKVMLQNTDLHIVFNGSLGTLSELGMTWISSWIHEPNSKPIILFGDFWKDVTEVLGKHMIIEQAERGMVRICATPDEVLAYIRELEAQK